MKYQVKFFDGTNKTKKRSFFSLSLAMKFKLPNGITYIYVYMCIHVNVDFGYHFLFHFVPSSFYFSFYFVILYNVETVNRSFEIYTHIHTYTDNNFTFIVI